MKTKLVLVIFLLTGLTAMAQLKYPETRKTDVKDVYFGVEVSDPYRWLEDDKSSETAEWVKAQNKVTEDYLSKIPFREKIKERFTKLFNYEKVSAPHKAGKYYFFSKNTGLQNQSVIFRQEKLGGEAKEFLDPNKLSTDGTVALADYNVSEDGKYFVYSTATGGSDWNEFYVIDVESGKKLDDHIKWVKFSGIAFYKDGFFYSRYPESKGSELSEKNEFHKIYYHKIGTKQEADKLIFEDLTKPTRYFSAGTTEDEKYLIVSFSDGTSYNGFMIKNLETNSEFIPIVIEPENNYSVIDIEGDNMLVLTDKDAPNYRLISIDIKNPKAENWKEVIGNGENVLEYATVIGGKLFAGYMKDACSHIYKFNLDGSNKTEIKLPGIGTVSGISGRKDDATAFYTFTSFTYPSTIFKFDVKSGESELYFKPNIAFNFDNYETKQIFFTSKDGTKVPMFVVHKKGLKLDGNNPTLLYGYGGFNISLNPSFSSSRLMFLEDGGIYVMVNLRGGGEFGEEWHKGGMLLNKQNVFDDFIAAAEYLIKEGYTSPKKLAVSGGSNGGLLVGAVVNQRPDLFRAAIPQVGVMDMLRYHKFTIGWGWVVEYGSSDNEEQFKYIYKYSPLHKIKENVEYPAVMVTTADHDDRVVPAHSFKYIATLQEKYKGVNPVIIRIESKAGHGSGKPTSKIIEEIGDFYSFIYYNLGMKF